MSSRKSTPDVLGDVLGGVFVDEPVPALPTGAPAPKRAPAKKSAAAKPAAPAMPAAETVAPAGQQWEYLEVVYRDYRGWRARIVNGVEQGDWKAAPTLLEHINQLGTEGWELVAMSERYNNHKEVYFKRPKR